MLKKLKSLLIIVLCFVAVTLAFIVNGGSYLKGFSGEYEYYLNGYSSTATIIKSESRTIFPLSKTGEAVALENGGVSVAEILDKLSAKPVFSEVIEQGESVYAYSPLIKISKLINGKRVNVQIFTAKDKIKIGVPIIYGSF